MKTIQQVQTRRDSIVQELLAIGSLRKGTINEQWFPIVRNGKKTDELRGPYYVHSYKVGNRTVSERIRDEEALEQARADTASYRKFKALCAELEELTAQLGQLERAGDDHLETLKKKPELPSSKTRK